MYTQNTYFNFIALFSVTIIIVYILYLVSSFVSPKTADKEKISAYECGFSPFEDARQKFDIRFYLVSILFIIFDLEIAFLFPWTMVMFQTGFFGFITMLIFFFVLTVGFIYEWKKGALDWE